MRLNEILRVGGQAKGFTLSDFDIAAAEFACKSEGSLSVYRMSAVTNPDVVAFGIRVDDRFVSLVVGEFHEIFGSNYFIVGRTWTNPDFRRRGFATALYLSIVRNLGIKILSDREQLPDAEALWSALAKRGSVKVLNTMTGEKIDLDDGPDPYTNNEKDTDQFRLVLERASGIPSVGLGVLSEYEFYTHPANAGEYV